MATYQDILIEETDKMVSYAGNQIAIPALQAQMVINDKQVTSKSIESLYGFTESNPFAATFNLLSTDWLFHYATEGRGPGKRPPIDPIKEWLRLRGLDEGLAYPISAKIGAEGTNPLYHKPDTLEEAAEKFLPAVTAYFESNVGTVIEDLVFVPLKNIWEAKRII